MWIFGTPAGVLLVLPLVCWLVVYLTQSKSGITSDAMFYLFIGFALWVDIPGMLFRQPLFDPVEIGYSPHGLLGWMAVIAFYGIVSLAISFTFRYFLRRGRAPQTI